TAQQIAEQVARTRHRGDVEDDTAQVDLQSEQIQLEGTEVEVQDSAADRLAGDRRGVLGAADGDRDGNGLQSAADHLPRRTGNGAGNGSNGDNLSGIIRRK